MTRFARSGKRTFHPASDWKELSGQGESQDHQKVGEKQFKLISSKSAPGKKLSGKRRRKDEVSGLSSRKRKGKAIEEDEVDEKRKRRREQRRLRRQRKMCFHCRKVGHTVSECTKLSSAGGGTGLCYRCGSTEHAAKNCNAKVDPGKEFAFAKCFICGETGHLSRQCPDNPRGLYPMGGSCHFCGSVEHKKSDCPENTSRTSSEGRLTSLKRRRQHESADAEYQDGDDLVLPKKKKVTAPKVVTF